MLWIEILLPILSIVVPVFATIYTVNKRIKAQTRENHQPHLILDEIQTIDKVDSYAYNLSTVGVNYQKKHSDKNIVNIIEQEKENIIYTNLILKNIGYGVATNIKFYNLITTEQLYGFQLNNPKQNQKLFTTLDIAAADQKRIPIHIFSCLDKTDNSDFCDHNRILCVYKDLNNYVSSFIIAINIKADGYYDFFAYQPSSISYRKWIKEGKQEYKKIMRKYKD